MGIASRMKAAYRALTRESFQELGLLQPTSQAGVAVNQQTALTVSAYWCGLNVIAGDIGVLDRFLYQRLENGDRERAVKHPIYRIVHDEPNPYMTPQTFWQTLIAHALSWGNGYAEIEWDRAGRPIALWPIPPNQIQPDIRVSIDERGRRRSQLVYTYYNGQAGEPIPPEDIIHIPGLSFDGIRGYSVVQVARDAIGLTMAAERFGAQFFGEGAWPGLALEHPGELKDGAYERLKDSIEARHQAASGGRSHRLLILEEGMKVSKPITISPDDSQFLETRSFQIEEMARILGCPVHKLQHKVGERPGGNLEASQIDYLQGCLLRWTTRIEQELRRKLISRPDWQKYYIEHLFEKLLKVDVQTRVAAEEAWVRMGAITPEYVAKIENFPPPPKPEPAPAPEPTPVPAPPAEPPAAAAAGGPASRELVIDRLLLDWSHGVDRLTTVAERLAARTAEVPAPPPTVTGGLAADRARLALRELVEDRLGQYVRRESSRVKQASKGGAKAFEGWIESFYQREQGVLADVLQPLVRCSQALEGMDGDARAVAETIARAHVARSREDLLALGARNLEFEADRLARTWEKSRPGELVDQVMALRAEEESNAA